MHEIKMQICCFGFLFVLMSCGRSLRQVNVINPPAESGAPSRGPKAPQGWDVGGGGNAYAAEFKDIGRMIVRQLKSRGIKEVDGISVSTFESVLEKLEVKTTEVVLKKGDTLVDALNYAKQMRIELSLVHWAGSMSFSQKRRLVVHEILGLMQKNDSDYRETTQLLRSLGFLHEVWFDEFNVEGAVAKTMVEKMPWRPSEVAEIGTKDIRETRYFAKREGGRNYVDCKRVQYRNMPEWPPHYICWFGCQTTVSEVGTILITLGPAFTEKSRHPLWRLFDEKESFDYGIIRGDTTNDPQLEIFP